MPGSDGGRVLSKKRGKGQGVRVIRDDEGEGRKEREVNIKGTVQRNAKENGQ